MKFKLLNTYFEITFLFVALVAFVIAMNSPFNVLATIASSLLHEMGHLVTMSCLGNKPQCIRFEITGMNIIRQPSIKISSKHEILIALGGPAVNGVVLLATCVSLCFFQSEKLLIISCINLILMTFNLLPVKSLDGGIVFYFLLSKKLNPDFCARILKISSIFFVILIYAWGVFVFASTNYNISVLIIAIFLTLSTVSKNDY